MSTPLPAYFLPHRVTVTGSDGSTGMGTVRTPPREDVAAFVVDQSETVVNADGVEDVSSAQVTLDLTDPARMRDVVTIWPGTPDERRGKVIRIERGVHPELPSFKTLWLK